MQENKMTEHSLPYPDELGFSCATHDKNGVPIETVIVQFAHQYVEFGYETIEIDENGAPREVKKPKYFQSRDRNLFINALKEAAKTPAGRIAIWAMVDRAQKLHKLYPDCPHLYKYYIVIDHENYPESHHGHVSYKEPCFVHLTPQNIEKYILDKKEFFLKKNILPKEDMTEEKIKEACLFYTGCILLHEMQHSRQGFFIDPVDCGFYDIYKEAGPQGLTRQMLVESGSPFLHAVFDITKTEWDEYVQESGYNPQTKTVDEQKATAYSQKMQQRYSLDFASKLDEQPYTNYTLLYYRFRYIMGCFPNFIIPQQEASVQKYMREFLVKTNKIKINSFNPMPPKTEKFFKNLLQAVEKAGGKKAVFYLADCMQKGVEPKPEDFEKGEKDEAYQAVLCYYNAQKDFLDNLKELSKLSPKIQDGDKEAQKRSQEIRTHLKKTYGLDLNPYNRQGQRVASHLGPEPDLAKTLALSEAKEDKIPSIHHTKSRNA